MDHNDREWLTALRQDLEAITQPAAQQLWPNPNPALPPFFNYRLEHVRQVERDAMLLLDAIGGDRDVVLAGVWLHDRYQPAFAGEDHGPRAGEWARRNLAGLGFPADKVERVAFAVQHHSDRPGAIPADAHEARLLWDADKLAHTGPAEVVTLLLNSVASDHLAGLVASPASVDRSLSLASIAAMVRGFASASLSGGKFYFEVSTRWADERFAAAQQFCEMLGRQACT